MIFTVKDFFEEATDRDEIIKLGGGSAFVFVGSADEWDIYSSRLTEARTAELKDKVDKTKRALDRAIKAYASALEDFAKFRPYEKREIIDEYISSTGSHCVIFEGDDIGSFWNHKEFSAFLNTGEKPKNDED